MESHCIVVHFMFTYLHFPHILPFTFAVYDISIRELAIFPVLVTQLKKKQYYQMPISCHGQNGELGNGSYTQETILGGPFQ